jgi:acyl-ACP thioesterase
MQNYFTKAHVVNYSEVDSHYRMRFDQLLSTFQTLTFFHSTEMQVDGPTLAERSRAFWVLARMKFEIRRLPEMGQTVEMTTWPTTVTPFRFLRDYRIASPDGEDAIVGTSEWCTLDMDSRTLRKSSTIAYPYEMAHLDERSGCAPFTKLRVKVEEGDYHHTHTARFGDMDSNGHTNNVVYMRMVLDAFTPEEFYALPVSAVEIEYATQSYLGDEIAIYKKSVDEGVYVEGQKDGKKIFHCLICLQ